jgi:hypothetical protein
MTLQSQELLLFSIPPRPNPPPPASQRFLDVPPSNPFYASSGGRPGKFEDITTVLGTGMDAGRGSAGITDWGKVQEIRGAPAARPAKPAPPAAPTLRR